MYKNKLYHYVGTAASIMSVLMYVSYIAHIHANLNGQKGNVIQPAVAFVNCILWTIYGLWSKPKDWPIIIANVPGIFLAALTVATGL